MGYLHSTVWLPEVAGKGRCLWSNNIAVIDAYKAKCSMENESYTDEQKVEMIKL